MLCEVCKLTHWECDERNESWTLATFFFSSDPD